MGASKGSLSSADKSFAICLRMGALLSSISGEYRESGRHLLLSGAIERLLHVYSDSAGAADILVGTSVFL